MLKFFCLCVATLLVGCVVFPHRPPELADSESPDGRSEFQHGQLVVHADFAFSSSSPLLSELQALGVAVNRQLDLPPSDRQIHIHLFETPAAYRRFVHLRYPSFPDRRAFFVADGQQLSVVAQWSDQIRDDLRHEVTHGLLHAAELRLPLWLDEGIAEYFEVPPGAGAKDEIGGLNRRHLQMLLADYRAGNWKPDLKRLESLKSTIEMTQRDYAESWAWVHFLLHSDTANRQLLQVQVRGEASSPLSAELAATEETTTRRLINHLLRLDGK